MMDSTLRMKLDSDGTSGPTRRVTLSPAQVTQVKVVAAVLLIALAFTWPGRAYTETSAKPFGVVPHKDNTLHIDPGVAASDSPFFPSRASTAGRKTKSDQFDAPEICGGCHGDIYAQWTGSMMANAWVDPIYRAVLNAVSKATGG